MTEPLAAKSAADQAAGGALFPGLQFYQVLDPPAVLKNGQPDPRGYAMHGPFPDLAAATGFAADRPNALITVTLVMHQNPAAPPPAAVAANPAPQTPAEAARGRRSALTSSAPS